MGLNVDKGWTNHENLNYPIQGSDTIQRDPECYQPRGDPSYHCAGWSGDHHGIAYAVDQYIPFAQSARDGFTKWNAAPNTHGPRFIEQAPWNIRVYPDATVPSYYCGQTQPAETFGYVPGYNPYLSTQIYGGNIQTRPSATFSDAYDATKPCGAKWFYLHEIGHIEGLGHTYRGDQVMFRVNGPPQDLMALDIVGVQCVYDLQNCATPSSRLEDSPFPTDQISGAPDVASNESGNLDVASRYSDYHIRGRCYHGDIMNYCNYQYEPWPGMLFTNDPEAISDRARMLDIFAEASDNNIYGLFWSGSSWSHRLLFGPAAPAAALGAASWGPSRLDVFFRDQNGTLDHAWSADAGVNWGIDNLGAPPGGWVGAPTAASWGVNHLDVFVRGADNHLWHAFWNGGPSWQYWEDLGGSPMTSDPDVTSWSTAPAGAPLSAGRLDVFARGASNELIHKWWDGGVWYAWQYFGGPVGGLTSAPGAVSWSHGRIDVYARGPSGSYWHTYYEDAT
jgi:hypothetical protein